MPRMLAALEINIAVQRERERKLLPKLLTNHMLFQATTIRYQVHCHLILYDLEKL